MEEEVKVKEKAKSASFWDGLVFTPRRSPRGMIAQHDSHGNQPLFCGVVWGLGAKHVSFSFCLDLCDPGQVGKAFWFGVFSYTEWQCWNQLYDRWILVRFGIYLAHGRHNSCFPSPNSCVCIYRVLSHYEFLTHFNNTKKRWYY